jgi:23S rRNA (uridine2552-2'-O)-methyltransferase
MDERFGLLKPAQRVVDLGAAPGGWAQVAAARVGSATGNGRVVGIDLLPIETIPGVEFIALDFLDEAAPERLRQALGGPADLVMSDMAANATGHRQTDHLRIVGLAEAAADFARAVLKPGGAFLAKVLQGGTEAGLLADLKRDFATVRHVKPAASRRIRRSFTCWRRGFEVRARHPGRSEAESRDRLQDRTLVGTGTNARPVAGGNTPTPERSRLSPAARPG